MVGLSKSTSRLSFCVLRNEISKVGEKEELGPTTDLSLSRSPRFVQNFFTLLFFPAGKADLFCALEASHESPICASTDFFSYSELEIDSGYQRILP